MFKVPVRCRRLNESRTKSFRRNSQQTSPMMVHSPDASDFFPSTPTKLVVTSLVVFLASIVIAVSFLWEKSKLPTYPTNSTWLQRKRQFRINGSKVIEQGFVEVSSSVETSW